MSREGRTTANADTLKKRRLVREAEPHPTVVVVETPDRDRLLHRHQLDGLDWSVGRAGTALEVLDPRLSKAHFRLSTEGTATYRIADLDTTNGTFLQGGRVTEPVDLHDHAVISAGDTLMVLDHEPGAQQLPAGVVAPEDEPTSIVGVSAATSRLRRSIATVADGPEPVLLLGETGVGKEVAANAIHAASKRSGPWVAVNCAAIPRDLADSMLFGHARGAFTGADQSTLGYFAKADGGTLFLDEIGELPTAVQAKLLRVLETGHVEQLGGELRVVDVRVISATHQAVKNAELFRSDLYARLSDWVLEIPPLRERRADILPLFRHFACQEAGQDVPITAELGEALLLYDWPQNVRELAKLAKRLVKLRSDEPELDVFSLPPHIAEPVLERENLDAKPDLPPLVRPEDRVSDAAPTRGEMVELLSRARGNIRAVARDNSWHRMQVYRWVKRYGIDPGDFR